MIEQVQLYDVGIALPTPTLYVVIRWTSLIIMAHFIQKYANLELTRRRNKFAEKSWKEVTIIVLTIIPNEYQIRPKDRESIFSIKIKRKN